MEDDDKKYLEEEAKSLVIWGFEHGFRQAIEIIDGIAKNGKHQESRDTAEIFVKLLEKCLPEVMASAPDIFSFDIIMDPSGKPKITLH